ncbi:hypothetical protein ACJX0J_007938, partial [Zea mays]
MSITRMHAAQADDVSFNHTISMVKIFTILGDKVVQDHYRHIDVRVKKHIFTDKQQISPTNVEDRRDALAIDFGSKQVMFSSQIICAVRILPIRTFMQLKIRVSMTYGSFFFLIILIGTRGGFVLL